MVQRFHLVPLFAASLLLHTIDAQIWLSPQASSISGGSAVVDFDLLKSSTSGSGASCGTGCGCTFVLKEALSASCNFLLPPPFVQLSVKLLVRTSDIINAACAGFTPMESCPSYFDSTVRKGYCPTPSLDFIGSVPFRLIYNGVVCADSVQNLYSFFGVLNINPMGGPVSGGTEFVVNLLGYSYSRLPIKGDILCIFSTMNTTVSTLSTGRSLCSPGMCRDIPNAQFSCRSPAGGIAGVAFSLSFYFGNDVWLNDTKKAFTPYVNPVLLTVGDIRIGPHAGGTTIDVYGRDFVFFPSGKCRFGTQDAVFIFVNSTYGRCISPKLDRYIKSSEVVAVPVNIAFNGLDTGSTTLTFVYYPDPIIDSVFPLAIPAQGGAVLTVSGSNFIRDSGNAALYSVYIGPNNPTAPYPTSTTTTLVVTAPPCIGGGGFAPVTVSVNRQQFASGSNSTVACFLITSVQPSVATLAGQSIVTVSGLQLTFEGKLHAGGYSCVFTSQGSSSSIEITAEVSLSSSDGVVVCTTPPMALGLATIAVRIGGLASTSLPFMIINLATVTDLVPNIGPISGSWSVLVIGTFFENSANMLCRFTYQNGIRIITPTLFVNSTHMRCMVPVSPLNWGQAGDSSQALDLASSVQISVTSNRQQYSTVNQNLTLFAFLSIDPTGSPFGVTTQVNIAINAASSLIRSLFCKFGNYSLRNLPECSSAVVANSTAPSMCYVISNGSWTPSASNGSVLSCVVPSVSLQPEQTVQVHMSLSFDGQSFFNGNGKLFRSNGLPTGAHFSIDSFSFFKEPAATSLNPAIGPHQGGTLITIFGTNFFPKSFAFDGVIYCRFGLYGPKIIASFIGQGRLACRTSTIEVSVLSNVSYNVSQTTSRSKCDNRGLNVYPTQNGSSIVEQATYLNADFRLYISYNGAHFSDATKDFHYYYINSVFPSLGPPGSSIVLQIKGANFDKASDFSCQFWLDIVVPAEYDDTIKIAFCRSPEKPADLLEDDLSVQVRLSGTSVFTQQGFRFMYYPDGGVRVTSVQPSFVAWKEATSIAIVGSNFVDSCQSLYCLFGMLQPNSAKCEDPTKCVTSIAIFSNSSHITCHMPAFDNLTSINVYVTMNNGVFFDLAKPMLFYGIQSLFPMSGSITGGFSLLVIGVNFPSVDLVDSDDPLSGAQCLFYNSSDFLFSTSGARQNPLTRHCTCILPPAQQAEAASEIFVDVRLLTDRGSFTTRSRSRFQYFKVPRYFSVLPSIGTVDGGTRVVINGLDFVATPTAQCKFGAVSVPAIFVASSVYNCFAPASTEAKSVLVYVTVNGQDYLTDAYEYLYAMLPQVQSLHPNLLPLTNSSVFSSFTITVRGVNFRNSPNLSCKFNLNYKIPCAACGTDVADSYVVSGTFIDSSVILCHSNPSLRPDIYEIQISLDAQIFSRQSNSTVLAFGSHLLYFYSVTAIGPAYINRFQGFRITVDGDGWPFMTMDPNVPARCQSTEVAPAIGSGLVLNSVSAIFDSLRKQYICEFNVSQAGLLTTGRHRVKLALGDAFTMTRPGVADSLVSFEVKAFDLVITKFEPLFGVTDGGFIITILGVHFFQSSIKDGATVTIGVPSSVGNPGSLSFARSPSVTFISDTCITAVAPRSPSGVASLPVAISINDVQYGISAQNFNFIDIPVVISSYPPSISRYGSKITVFGRNFVSLNSSRCGFNCSSSSVADAVPLMTRSTLEESKQMICKFQSPVVVVASTQLICDVPAVTARLPENDATLLISITIDGNQWSVASSPVHFFDSTYLLPSAASVKGGVKLTIFGSNFIAPLGMNVLPAIEYSAADINSTYVFCKWVASSFKRLQVGGLHYGFFECPSPAVSLNLSSLDFYNYYQVNVRVRMNYSSGVDWAYNMETPLQLFSIMTVTSITPSVHNAGGQGLVTVRGAGFKNSPSTTCRAHHSQTPGLCSFIDSSTFVCSVSQLCFAGTRMQGCNEPSLIPSMRGSQSLLPASSILYISISINGQEYSDSIARIIYISVLSINPCASSFNGGAVVTVFGINFAYGTLSTARCAFKDLEVQSQVLVVDSSPVNGTAITCVAPVKIDFVVRLELKIVPDGILTADRQLFYYYSQFPSFLLYPPGGWIHGGMRLQIKLDPSEVGGPNEFVKYDFKHPIRVQFDFQNHAPVVVEATIINSFVISCIVPQAPGLISARSKVRVNMNGQHYSNSDIYFYYHQLYISLPGGGVVQKCPVRPGCNRGGDPCLPWQKWPDEPESSRFGNIGCDDGGDSPVNFVNSRCNPLFVEGQNEVMFLGNNLYFRANTSALGPFYASSIVDKFDISVGEVQVNTRVSFSSRNNMYQASFTTNAYQGGTLIVHSGIGAGESCRIASYDGVTQTAVLVYPCQPGNRATNLTTGSLIEIFLDVVPYCRLRAKGIVLESPIIVPGTWDPKSSAVLCRPDTADRSVEGRRFNFSKSVMFGRFPSSGSFTFSVEVSLAGVIAVEASEVAQRIDIPLWSKNFATGEADASFTDSREMVTFQFYRQPCASTIFPYASPAQGGAWVTLSGSGFRYLNLAPQCKFGSGIIVSGEFLSDKAIRCLSPQSFIPLTVTFSLNQVSFESSDWLVTSDGVSKTQPQSQALLRYFYVTDMRPDLGNANGGTLVYFKLNPEMDAVFALNAFPSNDFSSPMNIIALFGKNAAKCSPPPVPGAAIDPSYPVNDGVTITSLGQVFQTPYIVCRTPPSEKVQSVKVFLQLYTNSTYLDVTAEFFYHGNMQFTNFYPKMILDRGGSSVYVSGQNFPNRAELSCAFGEANSTTSFISTARFLSSNLIVCAAPAKGKLAALPFFITTTGQPSESTACSSDGCKEGDLSTRVDYVTFYAQALVTQISPESASVEGGTTFVVRGARIGLLPVGSYTCKFGDNVLKGIIPLDDPTSIRCLILPGLKVGLYPVEISLNGHDYTQSAGKFVINMFPSVEIFSLIPNYVPVGVVDQIVTVVGNNFQAKDVLNRGGTRSGVQVLVNNEIIPSDFVDSNTLRFVAPLKTSPLSLSVEVSMNSVDKTNSNLALSYILNSNPSSCPENCLNRGKCLKFYVEDLNSPTLEKEVFKCQCNPPFFGFVCAEGGYAITTFSPRAVLQTGGAIIKVNAYNVASAAINRYQCKFGQQVVNSTINSTDGLYSVMTCQTPPLFLNGSVALSISIDGGVSWNGHPVFHQISYMMQPLAASVAPSIAPFKGGTLVTITSMLNTTFPAAPFTSDNCINEPFCNYLLLSRHSNMCCQVAGVFSTIAYFESIFRVVCEVPAYEGDIEMYETSIKAKLDVSLNGVEFLHASLDFIYAVQQSYTSILPSVGSTQGGVFVTLVGSGFLSTQFLNCKFGVAQATSTRLINSQMILLITPFVAVPSIVDIQCTINAQQWDVVGPFEYTNMWTVMSFFPVLGPETGNTLVTVVGSNFVASSNIQCKFGSLLSTNSDIRSHNFTNGAFVLSSTTVLCISPPNFIDRVGITNKPKSDCSGHFVPGRRRNLCIPLSFDCIWKNYDATTLYLSCTSTPFGEVVVFTPLVVDGILTDALPTSFELGPGQNLHPDLPLRRVVDVWITVDGQTWSKIVAPPGQQAQRFSFTETINVTVIDPDVTLIGSTASTVVVRGEGFYPQHPALELAGYPAVRCMFSMATKTYFSLPAGFIDPFAISCPVPAVNHTLSSSQLVLPMKISVEINGQQYTNNTHVFYFAKLWKVFRTVPSLSAMTGGTSVTIIGSYFRSSTKLNCKFGDEYASYVSYINETAILCRTPSMSTASIVSVEVTLDGFFWSVDRVSFEIYAVKNSLFFGSASYQQLGLGDSVMRTQPEVLEFMKTLDISQIALGQQHSLVIASVPAKDNFGPMLRKGVLYAWGDNFVGQLGHGDYTPRGTPVAVRGCLQVDINGKCISDFYDLTLVDVACGSFHSLALSDRGVLYAWGWNTKGQLGQGVVYTGGNSPTPLVVHALRNQGAFIRKVAGGFAHTVAEGYLSNPGESFVWVWGANDKGQLGLGDFVPRSLPTRIQTLLTLDNYPILVQDLKTGLFHTVVMSTRGDIFTVGLHSSGQLGRCLTNINGATGTCTPLPARVGSNFQSYPTFDRVVYLSPLMRGRVATSIAVGSLHTVAVENGGDLFAWGNNEKGQLGLGIHGSDTNQLLPTPVTLLGTKSAICGNSFVSFSGSCVPSDLYTLQQTRAVAVGAGGYHTFVSRGTQRGYGYKGAPVFAQTLYAFGSNEQGQLGLGGQVTTMNSIVSVPSVVRFPSSTLGVLFIGLHGGFQHSAVLQTCPPSPLTPCSRQGFCSPDSTCTCYKGFRGFECQIRCDGVSSGGASNICFKNGNSSAALLISEYLKAAIESFSGPAMFKRLRTTVLDIAGSKVLQRGFEGSFAGAGAFNSSTTPMPRDLELRFSNTSIISLIKTVNNPLLTTLVHKWTHPTFSPMHSRALFPLVNDTYSFQTALRIIEALVLDAFRAESVAGFFNSRQSQIKRVWDNTKIECGICDYVQIAFSFDISPDIVESIFKMLSDVDCSTGVCSGAAIARIASEFKVSSDIVVQVLNNLLISCPTCMIKFFDSGCMFDGSCICAQGWTGDECQKECAPSFRNPCSGNGRCLDDGSCDCRDANGNDIGWRGSICNIRCKGTVNGRPCNGNGVCLTNGNCQCYDGYRGDGCELACPGLIPNPNPIFANDPTKKLVCSGRGDCISAEGSAASCNCALGYVGSDCSVACEGLIFQVTLSGFSRLAISNCSGHGQCKSTLPTLSNPEPLGSCACERGWRLSNCSKECAGGAKNPCSGAAQGTCTTTGSCICEPGWRGASCNRECAGGFSKPCNNHGICTPFGNCTCFEGYLSFDCGFECEGGAGNPCNRHGICQPDGSCECSLEYRGRACETKCPGTNGRSDGYVCLDRGLCNLAGQCECTGVYAGEDCSQLTTWFILSVIFITIIAASFTTWTIRRILKYREKLARRKRRAIKKKPMNVDEPGTDAKNVVKRRAFQRQNIRKYMETGPTEEEITAHKQKQLQSRTFGDSTEDQTDVSNPVIAPTQPPPVTKRPNVRSVLNGLDSNLNATDSEEDMDKGDALGPRVPLEPNVRPRVPQLGVQQIAPPAPTNPPVSNFVRAVKGVKKNDENSAIKTEVLTPPRTTGIQISRFPSTDFDDTEDEPDTRDTRNASDSDN